MSVVPAHHRPWPLPARPPVMKMVWHDLLFMHWPVRPEVLQRVMPAPLKPDLFDGWAWIGVVPFRMTGVTARGLPPLRGLSAFCELNVRTYVTVGGKPGVFFFSLDAANRPAVGGARWLFKLPYMDARMALRHSAAGIEYESMRTHRGEPAAEFRGVYRPAGPAFGAVPGTLEYFLTERYCLYACGWKGDPRLFRCEVHHRPWPLRPAEAEVRVNSMAAAAGVALPERAPHLMFAERMDVTAWWLERVRESV